MPRDVFRLFTFTMFYFQIDSMMKPYIYDTMDMFKNDPTVQFHSTFQTSNIFILSIFIILTAHLLFFSKITNYTVYSLAFIYMKYLTDIITYHNKLGAYQYGFRRSLMWLFTTPLILELYCDMNNMKLMDVNAHYHIGSNALHIILYPFRQTQYYNYITIGLTVSECYFIYKLFKFKDKKYTKFLIYVWTLFSSITFVELFQLFTAHDINILFMLSDMIAKLATLLIVNDNDEHMYYIQSNIDLQSITLLGIIKKTIKGFESTTHCTQKCKMLISHLNSTYSSLIPMDKTTLKLELLKKILPLELEDNYLMQSKEYKPYNFICVLFTDIVGYTELSKKYEASVIYKMLNDVYTRFDYIVLKYSNLQKIETIGDAYMVVGDIYTNDTKNNVKNIILLALDLMREIKRVPSPDDKPLQLRIGINLGKVVVGILGVEIPRLCVIGNTVNVASRLQTTTDPDTIQISRHIYEIAATTDFGIDIEFELRENVFMKNLGSNNTYILRQGTRTDQNITTT